MLALLVWLAGCVFGCWVIWHKGYGREAEAFVICTSVLLWMVGGASWIARKMGTGFAARAGHGPHGGAPGALPLSETDREALKKIAAQRSASEHPL